ncbi:Butyrophilin subfamily 3 member A3, partial [Nibea albiflora]
MKLTWSIQFFLCSLLVNLTGESDVVGSHEPVKATVGQDVILPCHLEPPFDVSTLTVEWKCNRTIVHLYRSGADDVHTQDKNFKNRTSLFHEEMSRGNISLKLTNVTELDAGNYSCCVPKLDSQVKRGNVILTVAPGEGETSAAGSGLSIGAIIGIVSGIVIAAVLVVAGLIVWKKYRNSGQNAGDDRGGVKFTKAKREDDREEDREEDRGEDREEDRGEDREEDREEDRKDNREEDRVDNREDDGEDDNQVYVPLNDRGDNA